MSPRVSSLRHFVLAGILLLAGPYVSAQIAAKSPFMPPQGAGTTAPTAGAPLEFRGYMETSEGMLFRIHDPARKASTWVKVDEQNPDFGVLAKQYDETQKTLTIEYQGKTLTLAEREAKVVSSGAAAAALPPPIVPAQSNVPAAVTQAVVLNPTPADEQRRLDAVAAEVARRRALREQATQQLNQGGVPQVTPAAQGQQAMPALPQVQQNIQPQRVVPALPQTTYPAQNTPNVPRRGNVRQQ